MESIFLNLVNLSVNASYLVIAIVLLRFILKKSPKWVNCLLWGLLGLRLVLPFSLESVWSLIPSNEFVDPNMINKNYFDIDTGFRKVDSNVNEYLGDNYFEGVTVPADTSLNITRIFMIIWLVGMICLLIYTLISYIKLRKKVSTATLLRDNIKECETVASPFVLGLIKPKIYLPYNMDKSEQEYVIAHENAHIKRLDHLIKPVGFLILTVYWFNPLMWIAYILLCRDIELACDEKVIKMLGADERKDYSEALLSCSVSRRSIAACPLAFGEVGVKERVKSVLSYKKPAFWIIIVALVLSIVTAVCFLTVPKPCGINDIDRSFIPSTDKVKSINITGPAQAEYFDSKEDIEEIIDFLGSVKVSSNEIEKSLDGAQNYVITVNYKSDNEDYEYIYSYNFNSRCTEIQVNGGLKPSYIYRVKNSDEVLAKIREILSREPIVIPKIPYGDYEIQKTWYERPNLEWSAPRYDNYQLSSDGLYSYWEIDEVTRNMRFIGKTEDFSITKDELMSHIPEGFQGNEQEKFGNINSAVIAKYSVNDAPMFELMMLTDSGFNLLANGVLNNDGEIDTINGVWMLKKISNDAEPGGNPYFNATVLEVSENSVLVEPFEDSTERKSSDKIYLSLTAFPDNYPEMKVGDEIRVVYNGAIAESYPAQIHTVFAIYFLEKY